MASAVNEFAFLTDYRVKVCKTEASKEKKIIQTVFENIARRLTVYYRMKALNLAQNVFDINIFSFNRFLRKIALKLSSKLNFRSTFHWLHTFQGQNWESLKNFKALIRKLNRSILKHFTTLKLPNQAKMKVFIPITSWTSDKQNSSKEKSCMRCQ